MSPPAFTLIELLVVAIVCAVIFALILPAFGRARGTGPAPLKDSTCVRGIMQGMVIWAQSHGDRYPLPSLIDKTNDTLKLSPGESQESKNTSANIMSILVFEGYIPTEMLVSPVEANAHIKPFEGYQFTAPSSAANPEKALWDPAFNADFTGAAPGGLSYAHAYPLCTPTDGAPIDRWANTSTATEMAVANRGPEIASIDTTGKTPVAKPAIPSSITYLIHGARNTWEGNVGYNDNHVDFVSDLFTGSYLDAKGAKRPDCIFFDESDAAGNHNNYLGIFTKSGPARKDFKAIWD